MDPNLAATPAPDARPRRMRVQFTLRGLLLGLTLATLLLSHVYTSWRLLEARKENSRLRAEVGELEIDDPNRLSVVAVTTMESMTWKWRVHVPSGQSPAVRLVVRGIPREGLPDTARMLWHGIVPGEYTLTAAIRKNHLGQWQLIVGSPSGRMSTPIPETDAKWLVQSSGYSSVQAGTGGTVARTPGEPFVLLRVQALAPVSVGPNTNPSEPTPGVMLCVEDAK